MSRSPLTAGIIGAALMDGMHDLGVVDLGMPELPLDDDQRHALARHLDRVGVPELMLVPTSAQA